MGAWQTCPALNLPLGQHPVTTLVAPTLLPTVPPSSLLYLSPSSCTSLLPPVHPFSLLYLPPVPPSQAPTHNSLLAGVGREVFLLDGASGAVLRTLTLTTPPCSLSSPSTGLISHLAVAGVGLWVATSASCMVQLYHTETFIHMQNIDIGTNVQRVLAAKDVPASQRAVSVTALLAGKGLLWVGTNVGIALTIPLPRLEGVPIISGKANISHHAHFGPVRMFLPLQCSVQSVEQGGGQQPPSLQLRRQVLPESHEIIEEEPAEPRPEFKKQLSESGLLTPSHPTSLTKQYSSPMLGQRR